MANGGEGFDIPAGTIVMETAIDLEGMERDMRRGVRPTAERAGQEAGSVFSRAFGDEAGRETTAGAREGLKLLEGEAGAASEELKSTDERVRGLKGSMGAAGNTATGLALILGERLAKGARRATARVVGLAEIGVGFLGESLERVGSNLEKAANDMEHFGLLAEVTGRTLENTGKIINRVAHALTGFRILLGAVTVGTMAGAIKSAETFEETFNRIETVLPAGTEALTRLRSELSELSAETGIAADVVNKTFHKALTRLPRLVGDTEKALELVRVALEAQSTGFTTASQAIETYEAVLQGFQLEASNAEEISSKLFRTQELAGVSFDEIAQSIGDVAALTNALEGEFEELLGIYSVLVPTGQSVAEVTTQIRALISALIDPTKEAAAAADRLGVDMSASAIRAKGLQTVIADILEVAEGRPEVIAELIGPRRAQNLLVALSGRMETLRDRTEEITGATDEHRKTVDEMNESVDRFRAQIGTDLQNALRQLGFALNEMLGRPLLVVLKGIDLFTSGISKATSGTVQFVDELDAAAERAGGLRALLSVEGMTRFVNELRRVREGVKETVEAIDEIPETIPAGPPAPRGPVQRPADPISPDFARMAIEAERARRELAAWEEFLRTDDVEQYEAALTATQLAVNKLVREKIEMLKAHGFEADELTGLLGLYDRSVEALDVQAEKFMTLEERVRAVGEAMQSLGSEMPLPPGFESEEELAEAASATNVEKLEKINRRLQELREAGASADEMFRELMDAAADAGLSMDDLRESTEGIAHAMIRELIAAGIPAWFFGWADAAEDAGEETDELRETLEEMATLAGGILNIADALGVLNDDARQALRGVTDLAGALGQTAEEGESGFLGTGLTLGGFTGAVGAGVSILSGVAGLIGGGESAEERRTREAMERLRASIERLRSSFDRQREAISGLPGHLVAGFREVMNAVISSRPEGVRQGAPLTTADLTLRLAEAMADAGLSMADMLRIAESLDLPTDALERFLEGGADFEAFQNLSKEARGELLNTLNAMNEFIAGADYEELLGTFRGQMERLRLEFELFDIDDPIDQLRRLRELLLEFTDLPDELAARIADANLDTPEGRAAFEAALQELFARMPELVESGAFAELSPDEVQDLIREMEGLVDEAAEEGAGPGTGAESFQIFRGVSELSFDRALGVWTTMDFRLSKIVENTARLVALAGGEGLHRSGFLQPGAFGEPTGTETEDEETVGLEEIDVPMIPSQGTTSYDVDVTVPVTVNGVEGTDADEISRQVSDQVSRELANELERALRDVGSYGGSL